MHKLIETRRDELLGKDFDTTNSGKCFVIDYNGRNDVTVIFYKPFYITKCKFYMLQKGYVKNPLYPSVFKSGFLGVGKYSYKNKEARRMWTHLIERCCSKDFKKVNPHYKDVSVCDEWLNFQTFAEWCYNQEFFNAKDENGKVYHLDKDILVKGNKIYSPDTCCFVPSVINGLLLNCKSRRGVLPLGVRLQNGKYTARAKNIRGKEKHLGVFNCPIEAFLAYKLEKESVVKQVAEVWKGRICDKVFQSLMKYSVDIED